MNQEVEESKFIVLPKNQFLTMAIVSVIVGYALHSGVIGKAGAAALGGAVGQSIGVIAIACLVSMIPAGIYWLVKRKRMPGLSALIWIVWAAMYGFMTFEIIGAAKVGWLNPLKYKETLTSLHAEQLKDGVNAYESRNYTEAYRIFKSLAEQGNAEAQNNLGLMYDQGKGVRKDEVKAFEWYRKAADQGYALAQMNLGVFYHLGISVPKDNMQAYKWVNLSAAKGNKEAIQAKGVVSKDMTSSQIEEAQKLSNEWWEKYNK